MNNTEHFHQPHEEISPTWDLHQQMRNGYASIPELAGSAIRIEEAVFPLWNRHRHNAPERS